METYVILCVTVVTLYIAVKLLRGRRSKLAPSLPSIPVLGSLPFMSNVKQIHVFFADCVQRYGDIFSFNAGSRYTLVLNSHEVIREALVKKAAVFAGRGDIQMDKATNPLSKGIIFRTYDDQQKKHKALSLMIMKKFGHGVRSVIEEKLGNEVESLIKYIKDKKNGVEWYPADILQRVALNVICNFLFSQRFEYGEEEAMQILSVMNKQMELGHPILEIFPLLSYIPPFRRNAESLGRMRAEYNEYYGRKIKECLARNDDDNNYVKEFVANSGEAGYDTEDIVFIMRDLILAGTETTSGQLGWALVLLGNRPEMMKRLQTDIDAVVPRDRLPSLDDKLKLPYLEATILEVLRYRTAAPIGLPHKTLCDTELRGYTIPYNTTVMVNYWAAHMDKKVWKDPETFRPDRFLDDHNNIINKDLMIAFSLGKRACLGEVLARQEMFLFLSALLQQFNILPPEGQTSIREEMSVSVALTAAPHQLRLTPRQ